MQSRSCTVRRAGLPFDSANTARGRTVLRAGFAAAQDDKGEGLRDNSQALAYFHETYTA